MVDRVREVEWSRSASGALDEVVASINQTSPQNARLLLTEALAAASSLTTLAERGRIVPELADPTKRQVLVRGFRLMYRVTETKVTVVAFLRGRRAFPLRQTGGDAG